MRGRKATPTAIKELSGNPGKRPLNGAEPKPRKGRPPCPKHLTGEARKEWNRVSRLLEKVGVLTHADRGVLAAYCQAWAKWVDAETTLAGEELVLKSDKGNMYQSPWVGVARQAMNDMVKLGAELGLTPASRVRLKVEPPEEEEDIAAQLFRMVGGKAR